MDKVSDPPGPGKLDDVRAETERLGAELEARVDADYNPENKHTGGNGKEPPGPPKEPPEPPALILNPGAPLLSARALIVDKYTGADGRLLHHYGGIFHHWTGTHYPALDPATMRSVIYKFLDTAFLINEKGDHVPFAPNKSRVNNVIDALAAEANLPSTIAAPMWLNQTVGLAPLDIVACQNGLLHLPTRDLIKHTPQRPILAHLRARARKSAGVQVR